MKIQNYFKRVEIKYLLPSDAYRAVVEKIAPYTVADAHGKSTIANVYFDTPDYRLIRTSLEKPVYKEKLRLRSYGVPKDGTTVFLELKKKYDGVVYKRREDMTFAEARAFLSDPVPYSQVTREIAYCLDFYRDLAPAVMLSYDREAFFAKDDGNVRVTFDSNILWRDTDVDLAMGIYGNKILADDMHLMEIKISDAMPLWLCRVLTEERIYPTSFSKYGRAYLDILARQGGSPIKTEQELHTYA